MTHRTWESAVLTITVLLEQNYKSQQARGRESQGETWEVGWQTWSLLISLWGPHGITSCQLVTVLRRVLPREVHLSSAPTAPTGLPYLDMTEGLSLQSFSFPHEVEVTVCLHGCVWYVCVSVCLPACAVTQLCPTLCDPIIVHQPSNHEVDLFGSFFLRHLNSMNCLGVHHGSPC